MLNRLLRRLSWPAAGLGLLLSIGFIAAWIAYPGAQASAVQGPVTVALTAAEGARVGELLTVRLVVNNARDLAGFQATIAYDPDQLHLSDVAFQDELSRSGRDLLPLGPVRRDGAVVLGAATCPVDRCNAALGEAVTRQTQGVYGRVELASLTFLARSAGTHSITLEAIQLVDPEGNPLSAEASEVLALDVASR